MNLSCAVTVVIGGVRVVTQVQYNQIGTGTMVVGR